MLRLLVGGLNLTSTDLAGLDGFSYLNSLLFLDCRRYSHLYGFLELLLNGNIKKVEHLDYHIIIPNKYLRRVISAIR